MTEPVLTENLKRQSRQRNGILCAASDWILTEPTLHVLLSFAQFEREVTAERIRDKIAASKKKGMWMGGLVPLGYDVNDRRLVANRIEADTVNQIFRLYVELGTVRRLKDELDRLGIVTKRRVHKTGKQTGGKPFSRGNLYQLLSNPIYIGRIPHKGEAYPGEHDAIVELDTWQAVRTLLAQNAVGRTRKIFDENGNPLYLSQAHAHGRWYGYYISRHLMHRAHRNAEGWRIPARTLEHVVTASLSDLCRSESRLMDLMSPEELGIAALTGLKARAAGLSAGSGTTIIAAERAGRRGYGIEIDPGYIDTALRRYRTFTEDDPVHLNSGRTLSDLE